MDTSDRHRTSTVRRFQLRLGALFLVACLSGAIALVSRDTAAHAMPVTKVQTNPPAGSAWQSPTLVDPITIVVNAANNNLVLDQSKDYILHLTPGVDSMRVGLTVWGGHNVVIEGGHLNITGHSGGMELKDQTGTVWIHDLHISGGRGLMEGIDLQEPMRGATVVLRDVLIDKVHGSYSTNHADLIQTWAGPSRLLIDGFTGTTGYQGFFLLPNQLYRGPSPKIFDLRNVDIDDSHGAYALWVSDQHGRFPLNVENVVVRDNSVRTWRGWWLWGFRGQDSNAPGTGTWASVTASKSLGRPYVHAAPWGASGIDENTAPPALAREAG